jgi:hypothetical protein
MFMRKMIPLFVAAALPLAGDAAPYHKLTTIEMAVEMPSFEVRLDDNNRADLSAKPCDNCQPVTLHIDASTQLNHHGQPLDLELLNEASAQGATLFYLPATGRVTRIQIWH